LKIGCHVIVRQQRATVDTMRSQGVDMSELRAHHCITPEQWSCFLCSVSVTPTNKVLLQELTQLTGIKMLTSDFLEIFGS